MKTKFCSHLTSNLPGFIFISICFISVIIFTFYKIDFQILRQAIIGGTLISVLLIVLFLYAYSNFLYLEFDDQYIIVRWALVKCYKRSFLYSNIIKSEFWKVRGGYCFLYLFMKDGTKAGVNITFLVDQKDYPEIAQILKEKGIDASDQLVFKK